MARRNPEPIITQTEILAIAGRHIQEEIIDKRREADDLAKGLDAVGRQADGERVRQMTEERLAYQLERLQAIETMYQIQTGTELGLISELG